MRFGIEFHPKKKEVNSLMTLLQLETKIEEEDMWKNEKEIAKESKRVCVCTYECLCAYECVYARERERE